MGLFIECMNCGKYECTCPPSNLAEAEGQQARASHALLGEVLALTENLPSYHAYGDNEAAHCMADRLTIIGDKIRKHLA